MGLGILTREEEIALFAILAGDTPGDKKKAKDELWLRNQPIAIHLATKFCGTTKNSAGVSVDKSQLYSEAVTLLGEAINGFDYKRGIRFSTFAYSLIVNGLMKFVNKNRWIRFNANYETLIYKACAAAYQEFIHGGDYDLRSKLKEMGARREVIQYAVLIVMGMDAASDCDWTLEEAESDNGLFGVSLAFNYLKNIWDNNNDEIEEADGRIEASIITNTINQSSLPDNHKKICIMFVEGKSPKEIAKTAGVTEYWARSIITKKLGPLLIRKGLIERCM